MRAFSPSAASTRLARQRQLLCGGGSHPATEPRGPGGEHSTFIRSPYLPLATSPASPSASGPRPQLLGPRARSGAVLGGHTRRRPREPSSCTAKASNSSAGFASIARLGAGRSPPTPGSRGTSSVVQTAGDRVFAVSAEHEPKGDDRLHPVLLEPRLHLRTVLQVVGRDGANRRLPGARRGPTARGPSPPRPTPEHLVFKIIATTATGWPATARGHRCQQRTIMNIMRERILRRLTTAPPPERICSASSSCAPLRPHCSWYSVADHWKLVADRGARGKVVAESRTQKLVADHGC